MKSFQSGQGPYERPSPLTTATSAVLIKRIERAPYVFV